MKNTEPKTYPTFITKPINWARTMFTRDPEWTFEQELDYAVGYILARRFNSLQDHDQDWGRRELLAALEKRINEVTA